MDREYARLIITEFIEDQVKMGKKECLIIHGIGKGILREVTRDVLRKNFYVKEFKLDNFNVGCTFVKLK